MFRYILNYLRDPERIGLPNTGGDLEQLRIEADYYQLRALEVGLLIFFTTGLDFIIFYIGTH
jgi:hypothetical protein